FELPYAPATANMYAMAAMWHMHQYGTTSEQMAWVKVAASHHAQHNPHAMLRDVVTVEEVVNSPMIADPLHRLDCCVISDGGGALILAKPEIAKSLKRPPVKIRGAAEASKNQMGGKVDLTYSGAAWSGPRAFEEAGVTPADIRYASIYDSFTITVVMQLEDLGFCEKGQGGRFVSDGNLISGTPPRRASSSTRNAVRAASRISIRAPTARSASATRPNGRKRRAAVPSTPTA